MADIIPVKILSTQDVLYGSRTTQYRWEVLTHNVDGRDSLAGYLDGVVEQSATLSWTLFTPVKGSGSLKITDLVKAKPGMLKLSDVALESARLRPVLIIDGLPDIPLGVYLMAAAPESWSDAGKTVSLELLDRATVLDQDQVGESYTVVAGTNILTAAAGVVASAGEYLAVDAAVTATVSNDRVWPVGTTKLQIVNDLLDSLNYNSLRVNGDGTFRATPYVLPAKRNLNYELLSGIPRELIDGPTSIYGQNWDRDRDMFSVPNKVIAVQSGTGDAEPLSDEYTNLDPDSPFSYPRRGNRWITKVLDGVDTPDGTDLEVKAFLKAKAQASLIAMTSVQAQVQVTHLPVPIEVGDVVRFANQPAGIDKLHVVTGIDLDANPLGLMKSKLLEVVSL